jgi:hypothetical protein
VAGSTETDAGVFTGTISGKSTKGAFYQDSTWGSGLTLTGKGVVFNPDGSVRFKATAKWAPGCAGMFTYSGTITATGGTGAFKSAHGTADISGTTLTSNPDAATFHLTGRFKY